MDFEKRQRRQSLKVIISEAIMVFAVLVMVIVFAFIVSGYWLNSDFEVERQGMLQIYSTPTGADINIDGNSSWLQRTNTSKVLPGGEHSITLTKEGYDSWTKTITLSEGLLYRVHYPRLFLNDRLSEELITTTGVAYATISPDHETLLLINNTTKWAYIDLSEEKLTPKSIDIAGIFSDTNPAQDVTADAFINEIISIDWDADSRHVLFKTRSGDEIEWIILDIDNIKNSVNLTREFGVNFSAVKIFNRSANLLLAIQNGNLHKIDVANRSISAVLVENIEYFDFYNNEIFFSARAPKPDKMKSVYYLGKLRLEDNVIKFRDFDEPLKVAVTKFYEDKFILTFSDSALTLYNADDFTEITSYEINFAPKNIKIGHDGEFVVISNGRNVATLDMEAGIVREWTVDDERFGWLDDNMIYAICEEDLIVYDFDGLNRRIIARGASSQFPAGITDNRYLYYFNDESLVREWLIPR